MSDLVFKGCTRPAMLGGVPLYPLMCVGFPLLLIGVWGLWLQPIIGLVSVMLIFPLFFLMKIISTYDDQRLMQHLLRLRMSLRHRNTKFWGAKSYAAIAYKIRKD